MMYISHLSSYAMDYIVYIHQRGCAFKGRFSALFNFRGYQTIIAVGVVCFVHNGICMVYSALPVDRNGQKYIPGKKSVVMEACNGLLRVTWNSLHPGIAL